MAVACSTFRRREKPCARRKRAPIERSHTFAGRKVFTGTTSVGARWSGKIRLLRRRTDHDRSRRSLSRYESRWIETSGGRIFARVSDSGRAPLLLLHGHPQSNVMWHRLAPALGEHFTLVIADLPGYGWSATPR